MDEIDKLMSEIENLQKEMDQTTGKKEPSLAEFQNVGQSSGGGASTALEETLGSMKITEATGSSPLTAQVSPEKEVEKAPAIAPVKPIVASVEVPVEVPAEVASVEPAEAEASASDMDLEKIIHEAEVAVEQEHTDISESQIDLDEFANEMAKEGKIIPIKPISGTPPALPTSGSSSGGGVELNLDGNVSLKVNYEFEGQRVSIQFVNHSLEIQFTDGTELKIPIRPLSSGAVRMAK